MCSLLAWLRAALKGGPVEGNDRRRILRQMMSEMIQNEPDGYGQILRILSDVSQNPEIDELAHRAYADELGELLEHAPALGGVH